MHFSPILAPNDGAKPRRHKLSVQVKGKPLTAVVQLPEAGPVSALPPLVALHGISRNAKAVLEAFSPYAAQMGRVLIVPRFSKRHWAHFQTIGRHRADRVLLALLAQVQALGLADTRQVALFGYSGGAQLAHRFAMLYPQRVAKLHIAAAGWYCLPKAGVDFPMGLGSAQDLAARSSSKLDVATLIHRQLPAYLRLPLRLYVGQDDIARDPALRKHPTLETHQGTNRLARARSYAAAFHSAAQARGIIPNVTLTELPGCAHSFTDCAQAGMAERVCTQ